MRVSWWLIFNMTHGLLPLGSQPKLVCLVFSTPGTGAQRPSQSSPHPTAWTSSPYFHSSLWACYGDGVESLTEAKWSHSHCSPPPPGISSQKAVQVVGPSLHFINLWPLPSTFLSVTRWKWTQEDVLPVLAWHLRQVWLHHVPCPKDRHNFYLSPLPKDFPQSLWFLLVEALHLSQPPGVKPLMDLHVHTSSSP